MKTWEMIEKGKLIPDAAITTLDGKTGRLWDFRQKCHLLLLVGDRETVSRLDARLAERQKTLVWLGVQVVAPAHPLPDYPAGAYAIDRFGELLEIYPLTDSLPDDIERDFLNYEACHC